MDYEQATHIATLLEEDDQWALTHALPGLGSTAVVQITSLTL